MDSGIAYLLYSQSVIGAAAIWIAVALGLPQRDRASIVFSHTASIYVVLNLLISYSMFSIKTAALLWFVFGALARATSARESPAAVQIPFVASLRPQSISLGEGGLSQGAET
jgi:putative polymerase